MNPIVVNSTPFEPSTFAALSLLPILFFLLWALFCISILIFAIVLSVRFVRAHERIAQQLAIIAARPVKKAEDEQ